MRNKNEKFDCYRSMSRERDKYNWRLARRERVRNRDKKNHWRKMAFPWGIKDSLYNLIFHVVYCMGGRQKNEQVPSTGRLEQVVSRLSGCRPVGVVSATATVTAAIQWNQLFVVTQYGSPEGKKKFFCAWAPCTADGRRDFKGVSLWFFPAPCNTTREQRTGLQIKSGVV